jgi:hypothetical protein
MFCCQGKVDGSTGACLAGRGMSVGALPLMAVSAIVSAEVVLGLSVCMAANGREAALVLRKVRRFSMRSIMADRGPPVRTEKRKPAKTFSLAHPVLDGNPGIVLPRDRAKAGWMLWQNWQTFGAISGRVTCQRDNRSRRMFAEASSTGSGGLFACPAGCPCSESAC